MKQLDFKCMLIVLALILLLDVSSAFANMSNKKRELDLLPLCNGKNEYEGGCSFRGVCTKEGQCVCEDNFDGSDCSVCKEGLSGPDCDIPICFGDTSYEKDVCGGRGRCVFNGTSSCECFEGYSGIVCHDFQCNGIDRRSGTTCSGRGQCIASNKCTCQGNYDPATFCQSCLPSYSGDTCNTKVCSPQTTCNNRGVCDANLNCVCQGNFQGPYCNECNQGFVGVNCEFSCDSSTTCNGRGSCGIMDGKCACSSNTLGEHCETCKPGWYGPKCDFSIDFNSFEMSRNGDFVFAKVSTPIKRVFDCHELIDIEPGSVLLGTNPQCIMDGERNLFKIIMGSQSSVSPGVSLDVKVYFNMQQVKTGYIKKTFYQPKAPLAVISTLSPLVSQSCGKFYFNGASTKEFGKSPMTYSWRLISAPTEDDLTRMNSQIRYYEASAIDIEAAKFSIGKYTMRMTAFDQNTRLSSTDEITVTLVDEILPTVSIWNGDFSNMLLKSFYLVVPQVSFGNCVPKSFNADSYNYKYQFNPEGSVVGKLKLVQEKQILVFAEWVGTEIEQVGDYNFILDVTSEGVNVSKPFTVRVNRVPLGIDFSIDQMTQSSDNAVYFKLSKQGDGTVYLSCMNMDSGAMCDGFVAGATNINQITLYFNQKMNPGMYKFSAKISDGKTWTTSYATVVVVSSNPEKVIRVSIVGKSGTNLKLIDPAKDLILQSLCYDGLSSGRVFEWSSPDMNLDHIETSNTYIIIPKRLLVPGVAYSITLSVRDGDRYGDSSIALVINDPPITGMLSESEDGYPAPALVTEYVLTASNWFDSHLPLKYSYFIGMAKKKEIPSEWYLLKEETESSSIQTVFPNGQFVVKVKVSDGYGASSESTVSLMNRFDQTNTFNNVPVIGNGTATTTSLFALVNSLKDVQTSAQNETLKETINNMLQRYFQEFYLESSLSLTKNNNAPMVYTIYLIARNIERAGYQNGKLVLSKLRILLFGNKKGLQEDQLEVVKKSIAIFEQYFSGSTDKEVLESLYYIRFYIVDVELFTSVADLPALKFESGETFYYRRKMSTSSLGSLSDSIGGSGDKIELSSDNSIATFSIPRHAIDNTDNAECFMIVMDSSISKDSSKYCTLESITGSTITIRVSSIGNYVVGKRKPSPPVPTPSLRPPIPQPTLKPPVPIPTQPKPNPQISTIPNPILSVPMNSNDIPIDNSNNLKYLAFLLLIPVVVIFIIIALFCYFYFKKRNERNFNSLIVNDEREELRSFLKDTNQVSYRY